MTSAVEVNAIARGEHHRPEYSISSPETILADFADIMRSTLADLAGLTA